jgi:hypothetical protein
LRKLEVEGLKLMNARIRLVMLDLLVPVGLVALCALQGHRFRNTAQHLALGVRVAAFFTAALLLLGMSTQRGLALGGAAFLLAAFGVLPSLAQRTSLALLVGGIASWAVGYAPLE